MLFKNVAGQGVYLYAHDAAADAPKTGDASNITGVQSLDGVTPGTAFTETNPTEVGGGLYWQPLSQAETNGNAFAYRWVSGTADVVIEPLIGFTEAGRILGTLGAGTHTAQTGDGYVLIDGRLTAARAGYLDKLNVSGTLAHSDAAATYMADVSGLLTATAFAGALPARFDELLINEMGYVAAIGDWSTHNAADVLTEFGTGATLTSLTTATGFAVPGEYDAELAALQAGVDALAIDTGSGGLEVVVTVEDADETPLQGATVRFTEGATSLVGTSNASGQVTFAVDAATWRLAVSKSGYQHTPEDVVVAVAGAVTATMTAVAITPPAEPNQVTCYGLTLDAQGALEPEIEVTFELVRPTRAGIYSREIVEATSASVTAVVEVALPREAEYKFRRTGGTTAWKRFTTPDADTFELPPI